MPLSLHEEKIDLQFANPIINHEKCQKCKDILSIKDMDPNYEGAISTYDHESYCTLACFNPKD